MKLTFKTLLAALGLSAAGLACAPAYAATPAYGPALPAVGGIVCRQWNADTSHTNTYPADGVHLIDCVTPTTVTTAPTQVQTIYKQVSGLNGGQTVYSYNQLLQKGVVYFYFANRAAKQAYMSASSTYSGGNFLETTSRCGHTGIVRKADGSGFTLATAIYQSCTYQTGTFTSPNIADVVEHETGHSFDNALGVDNFGANGGHLTPASQSVGFRAEVDSLVDGGYSGRRPDYIYIVSGNSGYGVPLTCNIFPSYAPSVLEQDLGLPTISMTPVCTTGGLVNTPYSGLNNLQIAQKESPYFVTTTAGSALNYQELFAQEFAVSTGLGSNSQAPSSTPEAGPALPFINWLISHNGLYCSLGSVQNLRSGHQGPNLDSHCPSTIATDFTH